jgi:DNA-binding CsgD family transcriptional regulator
LTLLRGLLDRAAQGAGGMIILAGEGGTGKTRLAAEVAGEADQRGYTVARGRAYPMEAGVPYALFADALLPVLRPHSAQSLSVLARGGGEELAHVFPSLLRTENPQRSAVEDPAEVKTRVLWTMSQLVTALAARTPLLLVLDDVHAADAASLELLHFLGRRTAEAAVVIVCTYNESERRAAPALRELEQSLLSLGVATVQRVRALSLTETAELLQRVFAADSAAIADFAAVLYGWTRGNPFFVQETLRSLVERGQVRRQGARWTGWDVEKIELPVTIRDAVLARIERLSATARTVADLLAALGTRADHELITTLARLDAGELLAAVDELRRAEIIVEAESESDVEYDFGHPMLRQAVYSELGRARARLVHGEIADVLERRYAGRADDHAGELAYHFARADTRTRAPQAIRYLTRAGHAALDRYANREAVDYLSLALERFDATASAPAPSGPAAGGTEPSGEARVAQRSGIVRLLARARQRVGEYDGAIALWEELLRAAEARADDADDADCAALRRGLGLAWYWRGHHDVALEHFRAGVERATRAGDERVRARLRLAVANCLHELGHVQAATAEAEAVLATARELGDESLLARAHRALLLLHMWTGPPELAREHGRAAIDLATRTGERDIVFSCHWALGLLEGLTGHAAIMARHIEIADAVAQELRSPLFSLATAELSIEYLSGIGDWERGLAVGERAIELARSLNQQPLLTRLLVWTSLICFGRGETERGRQYVDEAWQLAGADGSVEGEALDVHQVVPAHIGRAAHHLHLTEYRAAIRVGEAGLAIADRTGYVFWSIHRLLPIVAEAYCHLGDIEGALQCEARLRRDSQRLGHRLGLAWADTCRAIVAWLRGDIAPACRLLRAAAESLESIPVIPDAARLRRQLAGRLAELGDREGALRELRHVHDTFVQLGAEPELLKARGQFRELGAKPPLRRVSEGAEGLTGRELEIARLAAARHSNKAIGRALDISPRTVSTHLSNIFRKLGVESRADLTDYVRTGRLD